MATARAERDTAIYALQEAQDAYQKSNQLAEKRIETLDQQVAAANALQASLDTQLAQARKEILLFFGRAVFRYFMKQFC